MLSIPILLICKQKECQTTKLNTINKFPFKMYQACATEAAIWIILYHIKLGHIYLKGNFFDVLSLQQTTDTYTGVTTSQLKHSKHCTAFGVCSGLKTRPITSRKKNKSISIDIYCCWKSFETITPHCSK